MQKLLLRFVLKTTFICIIVVHLINFAFNSYTVKHFPWIDSIYVDSDIRQVVTVNGYHFENHTVTTDDGYILQLHRLYSPTTAQDNNQSFPTNEAQRPVAFFMHGALQSSLGWLTAGRHNSIPYHLADLGYDVWLGNQRGNRYARRHLHLDADKDPATFFDFTWHEIGYYDLPNLVDYILEATQVSKIHCLTHSQGSAALFVMLSEKPEYNAKIRTSVAFAPAVYVRHGFAPSVQIIALSPTFFQWFLRAINVHELFPFSEFISTLAQKICHDRSPLQPICSFTLGIACGFNYPELNKTILPMMFTYGPAGASWKQLLHYGQLKNADRFQRYDHGTRRNLQLYGEDYCKEYNLTNVQIPNALFYSDNDWAVHEMDFIKLRQSLPKVEFAHNERGYAHMDYMIGKSNRRFFNKVTTFLAIH